jgi:hypothetical protein
VTGELILSNFEKISSKVEKSLGSVEMVLRIVGLRPDLDKVVRRGVVEKVLKGNKCRWTREF